MTHLQHPLQHTRMHSHSPTRPARPRVHEYKHAPTQPPNTPLFEVNELFTHFGSCFETIHDVSASQLEVLVHSVIDIL